MKTPKTVQTTYSSVQIHSSSDQIDPKLDFTPIGTAMHYIRNPCMVTYISEGLRHVSTHRAPQETLENNKTLETGSG